MKIFISADMEGIAGITSPEHTMREGKEHERARRLMTGEVNAAIEGVLKACNPKTILVNDSHGTMRNIIPEELHEAAELVTGTPKPLEMMQGIDKSYDAAFFIGYHAMRGSYPSVLEHTFSGKVVFDVFLNGKRVGETALNAAMAGVFGVPVALVTGDRAVTDEAKMFLGNVETVTVKEAVGRYAAKCLSPTKAQALIKDAAYKAVKNIGRFKPFQVKPPIKLDVVFFHTGMAELAQFVPGSRRTDGRTVSFTSKDFLEIHKAFVAMVLLAGTVT
ncbi:MAG: M55 family metallopeptidase [Candidatus Bathyarchaeales archaeon]